MITHAALALLLTLVAWPSLALAQVQQAGVVTAAQGNVTVSRRALQPVPLKFKDPVFLQDRVTTGDQSVARLLLGGKAVVTVRERSTLAITEVPGRSTIQLESGKIGLAVARDRMRPGEVIDIRTPNAVLAVRGTVVVVEVQRATAQASGQTPGGVFTIAHVLRGLVEAFRLDPQGNPFGTPFVLNVMQTFSIFGSSLPNITQFTPAQIAQILSGLQTGGPQHRDPANLEQIKNQLINTSTVLLQTITGGPLGPNPFQSFGNTTNNIQIVQTPPINPPFEEPLSQGTPPPPSPPVSSVLQNPSFETGDFTGWTLDGRGGVISAFGDITPPDGSYFALIHTNVPGQLPGCGSGNACQRTTLSQRVNADSAVLVRARAWLLSNEFPMFTDPDNEFNFRDTFSVTFEDSSGTVHTIFETTVNDQHEKFEPAPASIVGPNGFSLFKGAGIADLGTIGKTFVPSSGEGTLAFSVSNVSDTLVDSAVLLDAVVYELDPPLFFLRDGGDWVHDGPAPLRHFVRERQVHDAFMIACCGSSVALNGSLMHAEESDTDFAFSVLSVIQGGRLRSTTADPLVSIRGGTHTLGGLVGVFDLAGETTAVDVLTGLTLGADRPVEHGGVFLAAHQATLATETVLRLDTALLEATRPVVHLTGGSVLQANASALDLYRAKLVALGPVLQLDASSLIVNGPLFRLNGGLLTGSGPFISLANGSFLGAQSIGWIGNGGVFAWSGPIVSFSGSASAVSLNNSLCAGGGCVTVGGLRFALRNGATPANISVNGPAFAGAGNVQLPANAAHFVLSGAGSKITIGQ